MLGLGSGFRVLVLGLGSGFIALRLQGRGLVVGSADLGCAMRVTDSRSRIPLSLSLTCIGVSMSETS